MASMRALVVLPLLAALAGSCAPSAPPVTAPAASSRAPDASRFHVLMINGGGAPTINYQPYLAHLQAMRDTLLAAGIAPERIEVFSGDGADPAPDLALPEAPPESDFWRIRGTRPERLLAPPAVQINSELPGVRLRTASKVELSAWFEQAKARLAPGDVLLLYVTDHGVLDSPDPQNAAILLWKRERLTVRELGALLDGLDPGVRVVSLMSQCNAGAFAELATRGAAGDPPRAPFCGYFSSPADRLAYGCSSEDKGRHGAGHALSVIRALGTTHRLDEVHAAVLVDDDTYDAPLRSSDAYLDGLLRTAAGERGVKVEVLVDELLGEAWRDDPAWQTERALVDRTGAAFGLGAPGSHADLEARRHEVAELDRDLQGSIRAWRGTLVEANVDTLRAFLAATPSWAERVGDAALKGLDPKAARPLAAPLLADLSAFTRGERSARLELLHDHLEAAASAARRTEVRMGAGARMRTLLTTIAGRALLARGASPSARAAYEAIRACEDLTLPGAPVPLGAAPPARVPLPALADDQRLDRALRPSWAGITFAEVPADLRKQRRLPDGASAVTAVYPESPASAAGLEIGDLVLGPPGKPFSFLNEVRSWSMLARAGAPAPLALLRGNDRVEVELALRPLPRELPPLPPALTVGGTVPAFDLRAYHGPKPNLADGKPHLLFFWATWCVPCKTALPEVLAFERERKVQVVAVTDEETEVIDAFFKKWKTPFPRGVVLDDYQRAFKAFGLTVRPTFVLVNGDGRILSRTNGYVAEKGLGIEGWTWRGRRR